ncbi:pyridoxal phosphate-dependent transferase [Achaetomium macrosporum]|uniref:Pyridoxal phosphate-dependent transferase n=1 Tax=Achaetomium macrosporum TaxID=79813 RepID=A0AAN7HHH3_9PEZI|nr:pyridoxal phosphate-dependent transferase [Achaetomium macrosporum]
MAATLDFDKVRGSFPALTGEQVYLNNAGGSQTLGTVAERIRDYLLKTNVQLGATYSTGRKSTDRYNEGHAAAAKYIGASRDEIVLGSSTTQLFRNLIVSAIDHEANIAPWVGLAERQKLVLKWWKPNTDGPNADTNPKLLASDLVGLLTEKTRLVTCTHASNIFGTVHNIKAIASAVHSRNPKTMVCVDAVAYAPHRNIDVKDLGVDLYSFSCPPALSNLVSLGHFFNLHATLENKLGLAGASYELVHAIPAVVEYLDGKSEGIVAHEGQLQRTLLAWLNARANVTVWGERSADVAVRVPTVSFTVNGWVSKEVVEAMEAESEFGFRWGSFYSVRLVKDVLGLPEEGVIRVSMVHYNTVDEVRRLVAAMDKVLGRRK